MAVMRSSRRWLVGWLIVWALLLSSGGLRTASAPPDGPTPPVAQAGADQTARVGQTVTLDGSASTDVDGDVLTYSWTLPEAPAGSTATLADATAVNPRLTLDQPGAYIAQLIVNDGIMDSAPDTVVVSTGNSPPVADAGPDQSAPVGATVTLEGGGSSDVDGDALDFAWSFLSRPAGSKAVLADSSAIQPRVTLDGSVPDMVFILKPRIHTD
jgi:hypothetical protein